MMETVVLGNTFVESVIHFFQDSLMNKKVKNSIIIANKHK